MGENTPRPIHLHRADNPLIGNAIAASDPFTEPLADGGRQAVPVFWADKNVKAAVGNWEVWMLDLVHLHSLTLAGLSGVSVKAETQA